MESENGNLARQTAMREDITHLYKRFEMFESRIDSFMNDTIRAMERVETIQKLGNPICALHAQRMEQMNTQIGIMESSLDSIKSKLNKWAGGMVVAVALIQILFALTGPLIRHAAGLNEESGHPATTLKP